MSSFDYAIHSDFLIHWTGKDIDKEYDPDWYKSDKSSTSNNVSDLYIKRLADILKFGLWMTKEDEETNFCVNDHSVPVPSVFQTCFTELKLSESRKHARKFGWLSMIIYPSLAVKNAAFQDDKLRDLISTVKKKDFRPKDCNEVGGLEKKNCPIELDLDACRNF